MAKEGENLKISKEAGGQVAQKVPVLSANLSLLNSIIADMEEEKNKVKTLPSVAVDKKLQMQQLPENIEPEVKECVEAKEEKEEKEKIKGTPYEKIANDEIPIVKSNTYPQFERPASGKHLPRNGSLKRESSRKDRSPGKSNGKKERTPNSSRPVFHASPKKDATEKQIQETKGQIEESPLFKEFSAQLENAHFNTAVRARSGSVPDGANYVRNLSQSPRKKIPEVIGLPQNLPFEKPNNGQVSPTISPRKYDLRENSNKRQPIGSNNGQEQSPRQSPRPRGASSPNKEYHSLNPSMIRPTRETKQENPKEIKKSLSFESDRHTINDSNNGRKNRANSLGDVYEHKVDGMEPVDFPQNGTKNNDVAQRTDSPTRKTLFKREAVNDLLQTRPQTQTDKLINSNKTPKRERSDAMQDEKSLPFESISSATLNDKKLEIENKPSHVEKLSYSPKKHWKHLFDEESKGKSEDKPKNKPNDTVNGIILSRSPSKEKGHSKGMKPDDSPKKPSSDNFLQRLSRKERKVEKSDKASFPHIS